MLRFHKITIKKNVESCLGEEKGMKHNSYESLVDSHAETGTDVIKPSVTNMLYVTAPLNCVRMWKTSRKPLAISRTVV
jgi:hypothetical protein